LPALLGQGDISLPVKIQFVVNDSEMVFTPEWIDSLVNEAFNGKIYYRIVGASQARSSITTQIQVPQILSLSEVFRQIVLYYAILPDEETREREHLYIYPYFGSFEESPVISCEYTSEGNYNIEVMDWYRVSVPAQPKVEDRDIFNQILQASFNEVQSFGDVSDNILIKVAQKNNLSLDEVKDIYKNTILWQLGEQLDSQ